ncbi:hypothetical protein CC1G_01080 [Coprinopsis cinerea okayama7|uniref:2',3'-cyclic-nucleotide 3'-phosphodiesterase n=1 Tax=Coprinopsis cinerea (strain Okayama-7 / 130 / ATCC MYA-4618 / FGSC 9003) TaxID=240176 RepID=A8NEG2_COPC7|nr:hypothetical protein CC1G_01080 [Coprinopsis cinerea okayama7\|eukprot:XP_001833018.1 hypothetical protein CC1G_01080 [Coprinopsis cinerea okayama7\
MWLISFFHHRKHFIMSKINLWLMPSREDGERLKSIMAPLHDTTGVQPSSYPPFDPHVTLGSFIDEETDREALKVLLSKIPPPTVPFKSIEVGTHYFRSVFIAVEPTRELVDLQFKFNRGETTPLYPHVSLAYIADEDSEKGERKRYFEGLVNAGKIRERDGGKGVEIRCKNGINGEEDWMSSYLATEVWFVKCVGAVQEWKVEEKVGLGGEK